MLRSTQFDDIYFSPEDGLAETRHVFLDNNNLPAAWASSSHFTIGETGFGTGLNFLAAWTLFEATAPADAMLDFLSFELYPLSVTDIQSALGHFAPHFGNRLRRMLDQYPMRVNGWHRLDFGRVRLTLVFDDVNAAIPRVRVAGGVDAWFLDGFAPAKNPQMWSDTVFSNMARLSRPGATLASFTAAGLAKDGLRRVGFDIEKRRGYGRKRDMITGVFKGEGQAARPVPPRRVAIIGGGIAGAACAGVLRGRGVEVDIFDSAAQLAGGASGNMRGIFNPRFSARRSAESDFYTSAFSMMARQQGITPCGSLHLVNTEDKKRRFESCLSEWGWHDDHMRLLDADAASDIAGVAVPREALYLPQSGQFSPASMTRDWVGPARFHALTPGQSVPPGDYDATILACGIGVLDFLTLPLHTVRGQIMMARPGAISLRLKANLCYGGYIGPAMDGVHVVGSTFQKWLQTTDIIDADNDDIISRLQDAVPAMDITAADMTKCRAALRCTSRDHVPVVGPVVDQAGVYVSTAHGSHGGVSALMAAHVLADFMTGGPLCLPSDTLDRLSPARF